jgi:catechol 2,3-dioxygenase-like lactoylglutathione lyase family enzyme
MLSAVRSVGIYVDDQDRARRFFTEALGFELLQDTPMGEGPSAARWIEVAPPDRNVTLVLYTPDGQRDRIGTFSNVLFDCDDMEATHKELTARGVEFTEEPSRQFWGWWAIFKDPDGNTYGLGQRGE